jgi:small subunit ribosomal protein S8
MSMQDPVADMLTVIRNAQMMGIRDIKTPFSSLKVEILRVLQEEGFIQSYDVLSSDNKKDIQISLKYYLGKPVIEKIKRVSKPSLRVYRQSNKLPQVRGGLGISIVSTPKGVMTDKSARSHGVGGEIICTVE